MDIFAEIITSLQAYLATFGITMKAELGIVDILTLITIPLTLLYVPYRYLYTHVTSTQPNRDSVIPWLETQGFAEKYKSLVGKVSSTPTMLY